MGTVGIRELRNRLTHYLRRTRQGEEVVVTDRGRAIAVIQPIREATVVTSLEARLARLAEQGWITLPARKPRRRIRKPKVSGELLSKIILQDRR